MTNAFTLGAKSLANEKKKRLVRYYTHQGPPMFKRQKMAVVTASGVMAPGTQAIMKQKEDVNTKTRKKRRGEKKARVQRWFPGIDSKIDHR